MNRLWGIVFFVIPVLGVLSFVFAANRVGPFRSAWLPENYSETGAAIDELWYLVHFICGGFFLLTGLLLSWAVFRYSSRPHATARYIKENLTLELVWTIIPGAILVGLAFYQLEVWAKQRVDAPMLETRDGAILKPDSVRIVARQYGWEFYYPGADGEFDTLDDFHSDIEMVVPDDEATVARMESRDVIHSFFVPKLRLKHDIVPGTIQRIWFTPTGQAEMNIVCAELCGWGHYKMNAKLRIVSRKKFESWKLQQQSRMAAPDLLP
ncbi:MAG: cytochrome c oxidase subunit II [Planctomycetota bacterium]